MKPDAEDMTMTEKADAAFRRAAAEVIERARQTGTPIILWENGRIVKRSWDELVSQPTSTSNQILEEERESPADQARAATAEEAIG
jgi:hypothetical protein